MAIAAIAGWSSMAFADPIFEGFVPGNLVVSRSVYTGTASTVMIGQALPPNCPSTATCGTQGATNDGTYPGVWNNDTVDGSFGVTSPIFLDQIPRRKRSVRFTIPTEGGRDQFPSKSELA